MELTYLGLNTLEYDANKCTGCGMCVTVCPHRIFKMDGKKAAVTVKKNVLNAAGIPLQTALSGP